MMYATLYAYIITRLYIKTRYVIVSYLIIYEFARAEIDKDQNEYLLERNIKCGIKPKSGSSTKSRIVNGKPSEHLYPWMASIHVRIAVDNNKYPNAEKTINTGSGGVAITEKAIITCGHCLCNSKEPDDKENVKNMTRTCLAGSDANQNRPNLNEIWVIVGEMDFESDKIERFLAFDSDTQAFLYRYDPTGSYGEELGAAYTFSKNGDVGIIVKNKGQSLKGKFTPICLPTPDVFTKEKELEVKLAGWGFRYESTNLIRQMLELEEKTNRVQNSCLTNGGRLIDAAYAESKRFIPCKERFQKKYCWDVLYTYSIRSFSTTTELRFADEPAIATARLAASLLNDNDIKRCDEYYDEVKKLWIDGVILMRYKRTINRAMLDNLFDEEVQRFQIRRNKIDGDVIETCYNVNAVGQNGICETTENAPFNWGFCLTSCDYTKRPSIQKGEPYHEAIFKYLDTAPKYTFYSGNSSQDFTL